MDELLKLLKENAMVEAEDLAKMLNMTPEEVAGKITSYEEQGIIRGYQAIVNEDKLDGQGVTAVITVSVTPEREGGFDRTARHVSKFPEVQSVYLVSGTFDLLLFVSGKDLRWVGQFVAEKLSSMDGVTGTTTHFMLKTYKDHGILMESHDEDERLKISP